MESKNTQKLDRFLHLAKFSFKKGDIFDKRKLREFIVIRFLSTQMLKEVFQAEENYTRWNLGYKPGNKDHQK